MKGEMSQHGFTWGTVCAAALLLLIAAEDVPAVTAYGPAVSLGGGTVRTYLVFDQEKRPMEVGVVLDEAAVASLPADGAPGGVTMPDGHSTFEYPLQMPAPNPTPFRHVTLDWNPSGHIPLGIYDRPHFDVHFYVIENEERLAIHPDDPQFMEKARRLPAPKYIPAGYFDLNTPPVPLMGLHLLDPTSPELRPENPQPFTHTLLYGSWDGRIIFIEPMLTTKFLGSRPDITVPFPRAAHYQTEGPYPGAYRVRWVPNEEEYRVGLTEFRHQPESTVVGSSRPSGAGTNTPSPPTE